MAKLTAPAQKQHNKALLLSTIYSNGNASRVRLASLTGLSRPTVTEITQELLEQGLVAEIGPDHVKRRVGRQPTLLTFNRDAYHLIALDIGGTTVSCALMDLRGEIRHRQQVRFDRTSVDRALHDLQKLVDGVVKKATRPLMGIAVGVAGRIDSDAGVVCGASNLGWRDVPLARILSEHFRLPVYIDNDTNLAALGEYRFGPHRSTESLVVIMLGTGIGSGMVVNGEVVRGQTLGAGEIGHIPFAEINEICSCGRRGCLETVSSGWGIAARAQDLARSKPQCDLKQYANGGEIDALAVQQAAEQGDPDALALLARAGTFLGHAITSVIQLLNPGHIAIAGSLVALGSYLFDPMEETIRKNTLPEDFSGTKIALSTSGDRIVLLGAAAMLLEAELGLWRK